MENIAKIVISGVRNMPGNSVFFRATPEFKMLLERFSRAKKIKKNAKRRRGGSVCPLCKRSGEYSLAYRMVAVVVQARGLSFTACKAIP